VIGLRINPQLGLGTIEETSTAAASSKFGQPLAETRGDTIQAFVDNPFMRAIHVHVGSQGCPIDMLVEGARSAVDLANEINQHPDISDPQQVRYIDIGGGLSVDYDKDDPRPTFTEYARSLKAALPELFDESKFIMFTEFGRKINASPGFVAARVEWVKECGGVRVAIAHTGADMFIRPVYRPEKWYHRVTVLNSEGGLKESELMPHNVAGPLCFSGDMVAVNRMLPKIEEGDIVVVHDAGGYTYAMHSRYTSQLGPGIYGFHEDRPDSLQTLKPAETLDDLVAYHFRQ